MHVKSENKKLLLRGLTKKNCELYGVIGRRAFHIFDKTHLTWICSSKVLGYQYLDKNIDYDCDTEDEERAMSKAS